MRTRPIVITSLALALAATATPAVAAKKKPAPAPKPVCYLLVDDKNDGSASVAPAVLRSPALDIHSADVATGKKTVTVVLRLATTQTNDAVMAMGAEWSVSFVVKGTNYTFERRRSAGQTPRLSYSAPGGVVTATETATDVKWVVPRAAIAELKKPKMVFETLAATSRLSSWNADAGTSAKKYPDMYPSCLKPA